ncbi:MAG TPA: hypothetical protein PK738_04960 [Bacteroidales bacterium]|nr:hypothetical protein [Bacteroidales bacterium]
MLKPWARLDKDKAQLLKLQHDVVFDPSLKPKMQELEATIACNEAVLDKLEKECAAQGMTDRFSLAALRERLRFLGEQLESERQLFNNRTLPYRAAAQKIGVPIDTVRAVIDAKADYDDRCKKIRAEYSMVSDNMDALRSILAQYKW